MSENEVRYIHQKTSGEEQGKIGVVISVKPISVIFCRRKATTLLRKRMLSCTCGLRRSKKRY